MVTAYDWISVAIFAGLVVLFLQRSTTGDDEEHNALWMYLVAGVGCAVTNYLGNKEMHVPAIVAIGLTFAFILHFLRPFPTRDSH